MKNYSVTYAGVILAVIVPLIGNLGFSEQCSSEVGQFILTAPGLIVALVGRFRQGDVTIFGSKK